MTDIKIIEKPDAILIDLDDTILNYTAAGEKTWLIICRRFAQRLNGIDANTLFDSIMETSRWYWDDQERHRKGRLDLRLARREPVSLALNKLGINTSHLADEIGDAFHFEREQAIKSFPKSINTLKHFKTIGIKLALLSNGSSELQRAKIKRFRLSSLFDDILIEGELGFGKPDKRVFEKAINLLGVSAEQTWMIGDDLERDIAGAQYLGIYGIWVDWRSTGLPQNSDIKPDKIIQNISDLYLDTPE